MLLEDVAFLMVLAVLIFIVTAHYIHRFDEHHDHEFWGE